MSAAPTTASRDARSDQRRDTGDETRPDETRPDETRPDETRLDETKPAETRKPAESRPGRDAPEGDSAGGQEAGKDKRSLLRQHPYAIAGGVIVLLVAIAGGVLWWLHARHFESTDDAFVDTRTVTISPQVSGLITDVSVGDNQVVQADAVLARIDERDYAAAVDQADAQIEQAEASIANFQAQIEAQQSQIEQAKKSVAEAQAALAFARDENTRYQDLVQRGAGTAQRAQQAASDLTQRQAAFASAQAAEEGAEKQVAVLQAQKRSAEAQRDAAAAQREQAGVNIARTTIRAPVAGRITKLSAAKGGYAATGQALMMLVPLDVWVTANFKETQLADMRPGQPVSLRVDAYPGRDFRGHVDSIQAGSGTAFSLLPAENATGNYVKVVQRVPVKIVFDEKPDVLLGPGMSVVPSVTVR